MRQHLNADTVLDEDNSPMSIAEYNRKHHTGFTLEQVYGKRYADSIPTEERAFAGNTTGWGCQIKTKKGWYLPVGAGGTVFAAKK